MFYFFRFFANSKKAISGNSNELNTLNPIFVIKKVLIYYKIKIKKLKCRSLKCNIINIVFKYDSSKSDLENRNRRKNANKKKPVKTDFGIKYLFQNLSTTQILKKNTKIW